MEMNIIFLWDSDLNSGNTGIMLSGKYFISYEQKTGKLYIRRNDHYVENFWGTQVRIALQSLEKMVPERQCWQIISWMTFL